MITKFGSGTGATGVLLARWRKHHDWVQAVEFSPDGSYLVSTGNDGLILVWPIDGQGQCQQVQHQPRALRTLDLDTSGQYLAVGGTTGEVQVFSTASWESIDRFEKRLACPDVRCVRFAPHSTELAACARFGPVHCWQLGQPELLRLGRPQDRSQCIAYSWDGNLARRRG